jgi:hypothetical protein
LLAALLLVCLFAQAVVHARSASITFDEGPHLATGYTTLRTGDLRLQPVHIHPPLANVLAAAPLLLQPDLPDPRGVEGWGIGSLSAVTDAVVWQYPNPRPLALASRLPIVFLALLLGAVLYRWTADLLGPRAGLLALALYVFDPNVIAHGSLVTTDMAVTLWGTLALFLAARGWRGARPAVWGAAGASLGLALSSKVSAVSLLPVLALLALFSPGLRSWRARLLTAAGVLGVAGMVLWAAYGFEVRALPGFPFPVPAATHVAIYRSLQEHYGLGHPTFLLGRVGTHGWWTYFPVAFLLKTPLATLLLLLLSAGLALSRLPSALSGLKLTRLNRTQIKTDERRSLSSVSASCFESGLVFLFPLLYAASSLFSTVNIGYRHLLPLLPFLFIAASYPVTRLSAPARRTLLLLPLIYHAVAALLVAPNYLAYFNPLAGGAEGGYRALVDSNLDWGQNLWQLREWMEEQAVERVRYAHFSPARPSVYGIAADFLPPDPRAVDFDPFHPAAGVYAIGATVLQGPYAPGVNTYAWFRHHEPVARLGHALFVYQVEERPAPAWAAVCAQPVPILAPEAVRAGFGQPGLRVVPFDCGQSWLYPAGGPGAYVLPPGEGAPPHAAFEFQARHADGNPLYRVYTSAGGVEVDVALEGVRVEGPLELLGYRVVPADGTGALSLWTYWRVREVPGRPLSLMAHLVGSDGTAAAVGDGLGMPIAGWRVGDVIVQRHRLEGAAPGVYTLVAGGYWLDTMERWPVHTAQGESDRVVLEEVGVR